MSDAANTTLDQVEEAVESEAKTAFREKIPYQAILLGGFALVASALLGTGNDLTKDDIALRLQEDLLASLDQVVPPKTYNNNILGDKIYFAKEDGTEIEIYRGMMDGEVSSLAYGMSRPGYSGSINIIMGVDNSGEILGVRVLSHTETPGLGDKIEIAKDKWITKFNGLSFANLALDKWAVKKDGGIFDQFSGATITPRAVVNAVTDGLNFFKANKAALLNVEKTEKINE